MKILTIGILLTLSLATVYDAVNDADISTFLEQREERSASLLFYTPKSKGLFSLFGVFSKEETDSTFMAEVGENTDLLKIDVTNPEFQHTASAYNVIETPRIFTFDQGVLVINEKPGPETQDNIIEIASKYVVEEGPTQVDPPHITHVSPVELPNGDVEQQDQSQPGQNENTTAPATTETPAQEPVNNTSTSKEYLKPTVHPHVTQISPIEVNHKLPVTTTQYQPRPTPMTVTPANGPIRVPRPNVQQPAPTVRPTTQVMTQPSRPAQQPTPRPTQPTQPRISLPSPIQQVLQKPVQQKPTLNPIQQMYASLEPAKKPIPKYSVPKPYSPGPIIGSPGRVSSNDNSSSDTPTKEEEKPTLSPVAEKLLDQNKPTSSSTTAGSPNRVSISPGRRF